MDKLEPAKLYITGGSPFARFCRILVKEWQIPVQEVEVPFPLPDNIFDLNPMGQVPVLETFGETIFPTSQIAEQLWAMTEEAMEPYWDPLADRQLLTIVMDVGNFLVSANYQHWAGLQQVDKNRLGFDPAEQNILRVQKCLAWVEERSQTWLRGDEPTICDYALACILLWSDSRRPIEWRHNVNIARIVDVLKERPSFTATAPTPWEK